MQSLDRPVLLYIIKHSFIGGSALHVLQLIRHFSSDYEVHLCVGEWGHLAEVATQEGYSVRVLPAMGGKPSVAGFFSMGQAIQGLIQELNPDIVHLHATLAGVVGRLVCRKESVPCVLTVHGWNFVPGPGWRRRLLSWLLELYAAIRCPGPVITVSDYDARMARRYLLLSKRRLRVIHNGLADIAPPVRHRENVRQECVRLIMVARFAEQKNQALLIDALAQLPDLNWMLQFVGEGETLSRVKAQAGKLGVQDKVDFLGARDDVQELLCAADIFVLTTNYEGLPLAVIEAMRAGLPVLATRVGGMAELVVDGETGYLHESGDSRALAVHLAEMFANVRRRRRMGHAARDRFEKQFSEQIMFHKTAVIYEQLLSQSTV